MPVLPVPRSESRNVCACVVRNRVFVSHVGALRRALALASVALLCSGCAHNLLYDENRDKQGQELKKAATEARLVSTIVSMEKAFADVAAREEENAREQAASVFDNELNALSQARSLRSTDQDKVRGLISVAERRLAQLGVKEPVNEQLTILAGFPPRMQAATEALEMSLASFRGSYGHQFRNCQEIYGTAADPANKSEAPSDRFIGSLAVVKQASARIEFPELVKSCKKIDALSTDLKASFDRGLVARIAADLATLEQEMFDHQLARRDAATKLDEATARFKGAQAQVGSADPKALKSVQERAAELQAAVAAIGELNLPSREFIAEEKLGRLDVIFANIAGTPPEGAVTLSEDDRTAIAIVRGLPELADEADKLLTEAVRPRLVPFTAAMDQQKLVVQSFKAADALKAKRADALRQQLQALLSESMALAVVFDTLTKDDSWSNQSLMDLDRNLALKQRTGFYRALAIYADDVQQARIDAAVWTVRANAAKYEESLTASRFAAAQWDGLIDTMATVLADYHGSGIKRAEIAEFFKALGLVAIGVGAAQ